MNRSRENWIRAVLILGLGLRLALFCGDGLGDDPNYFVTFKNLYNGRIFNSQYYYRFSYWIPQVLLWKIFGIGEFTFILPVLLSSLGCIYVVYLITKELFGLEAGLIASALMAVNPFEVLNGTLLSTDVNLSLYMLLSIYFFILAQRDYSGSQLCLSAVFVFLAFVNKPFGVYVLPVLGIFYLAKERLDRENISRYWPFGACLISLFGALFVACWVLTGDPFTYVTIFSEGREPPHIARLDLDQLAIYPRQMFFRNEFGERLHGYHFYAVMLCLPLAMTRPNGRKVIPIIAWFLTIFALVEFMPQKLRGLTPYTIQRIFRYFVIVIPPSVILVGYCWNKLRGQYGTLFVLLFPLYVGLSVYWCYDSTRVARIAFGEVRSAIKHLRAVGDSPIYADWYFISKIQRLEMAGAYNVKLRGWTNVEGPEAWQQSFRQVQEGYVVTGGPRLPYYGCSRCIPTVANFIPPGNWRLIKEFDGRVYPPWKTEPLRIWHVERAPSRLS